MLDSKYIVPDGFSDVSVWLALIKKRSKYGCKAHCNCAECKSEQLCCEGGEVCYKNYSFVMLGTEFYKRDWHGHIVPNTISSKPKDMHWRLFPDMPDHAFKLVQKIVRLSGQNLWKDSDYAYWEPSDGFVQQLTFDEIWRSCDPMYSYEETAMPGVYVKTNKVLGGYMGEVACM